MQEENREGISGALKTLAAVVIVFLLLAALYVSYQAMQVGLGRRLISVPVFPHTFCLVQQILLHHLIHPQVNAAVELGALREIQPKDQRTVGLFGRE